MSEPNPDPRSEMTPLQLLEALNAKLALNTHVASIRATYNLDQLVKLNLQIDKAQLMIRGLRNACTPVNTLPPDILALVLESLANQGSNDPCANHKRQNSQSSPYDWLPVTHVCRYWRDIALSLPHVWSTIDYSSPQLALMCLERSRATSLDVRVRVRLPFQSLEALPDWLSRSIPRLRSLELDCSGDQFMVLSRKFSESQVPLLRSLSISSQANIGAEHAPRLHLPSLERLTLGGTIHTPLQSRFGNLVELNLMEGQHGWIKLGMSDFLDVLQANPKLSSIHMDSLKFESGQEGDRGAEGRLITLMHLQMLTLIKCASRRLLEHLVLAPLVRLRVDVQSMYAGLSLADILPPSIENLHNLDCIEEVHSGRNSDPLAPLSVSVDTGALNLGSVRLGPEWFAPVPLHHVRVLSLHSCNVSGDDQSLLFSLPALEVLIIGGYTTVEFFEHLHPSDVGTLCPLLKELQLSYWSGVPELACAREAKGIPLQKVVIKSLHMPPSSKIAELRGYVSKVECYHSVSGTPFY